MTNPSLHAYQARYENLILGCTLAVRAWREGRRQNSASDFIKAAYLIAGFPIEILGDLLTFWKKRTTPPKNLKKVLIAKTDQLGDVLFATLLIEPLRTQYPGIVIDYIVQPKAASILAGQPIRKVWLWDDVSFVLLPGRTAWSLSEAWSIVKACIKTLKALRAEKYDLIINARVTAPSGNMLWRWAGAPLAGWSSLDQGFLLDLWADADFTHQQRAYRNLLRACGVTVPAETLVPTYHHLETATVHIPTPYAVLGPATYDTDRSWSIDAWRELITWMRDQGLTVAINALKEQRPYIEQLREGLKNPEKIIILEGMPIPQFASVVAQAKLFAGIDSFPAHLALALKTPGICFINTKRYFVEGASRIDTVFTTALFPSTPQIPVLSLETTGKEAIEVCAKLLKV